MKQIIGLVGQQAAGKGTIAKYLKEKYKADVFRFADPLFEICAKLSLELTRDNLIKASEIVREVFGETILAQAISVRVEKSDAKIIVVDGVRRAGDIETLKKFPGFHLVAVIADQKIRWQRSRVRGEKEAESQLSFEEFQALEQRSTEVSALEVERDAELSINNNGTREELEAEIESLLDKIGFKK